MSDQSTPPIRPSPTDATIDASPEMADSASSSRGSLHASKRQARVELIAGTAPHLTSQTERLLRVRLRMAVLVLFFGFAAFLVRNAFELDFSVAREAVGYGLQVAVTVVLGLLSVLLCRRCAISVGWLRLSELLIFGLPAALFLFAEYSIAIRSSERGYFDFPGGFWLVLIYTYALFIPNTPRRAAVVISLMTAAPVAHFLIMFWTIPRVGAVIETSHLTGIPLMFVLAAIGSIYGAGAIGSLRREVYEARQLGQYQLKRRIGAGGMGEVYFAEHQLLKRPCVIKLIRPEHAGDERVLARFQREVRATAKLSHWNNIDVFDYGRACCGTFYYVMEYLPGMSLGELVDHYGPMPPERVIYLLRQVCDALSEAHSIGLIHRDIKPGQHLRGLPRRALRRGQAARFRPSQAARGRGPAGTAHARRGNHRHASVHVTRAGHRRYAPGCPERRLCAGRRGVLPADRPAPVRGGACDQADDRPCPGGGRPPFQAPRRGARRPGRGRSAMPGQVAR